MRRTMRFHNADGIKLHGALELPPGRIRAVALFAHCFTGSSAHIGARRITTALAANGIATLAFDFTGLGKSEGSFADSDFDANVADLIAAAAHLRSEMLAPAILVGHSLGGAAVIAAAEHIPEAKAVVTIGAPFDPAHVLHQLGDGVERVREQGVGEVAIGGRPFTVTRDFIAAAEHQDQAARLARLKRALLVMHAPTDTTVGIENAGKIFVAAKHPKSFIALEGADHLLTVPGAASYAASIIAAWSEAYLPAATCPAAMPEGHVTVTGAEGKFLQIVDAGGHSFLADEPLSSGGTALGPTPYDLLLSALGTCTSMTIELVAARENIPLEGQTVTLEHRRCHGDDCAADGGEHPKLELIERVITLSGPLTEQQRNRLLVVADKCPVHRTLEGGVTIRTSLAT
ncbi:bifunctional alpha/beta hydrolase/OsmC family protein [Sphingomonas sp. AR_OL41]|uniref:bifunctional alpha/beta hydrolase/OsmC family protein n=1 Tax=Sphingomonas sp. AR_OL41 TaxID=3042729 RepID=UPI00248186DB|nr:bifunctional alpha/beta hydrolase/OsmC family protein [Sphingomonas sp. AR_OL41]MDH7975306.1 bifunctional alpha/beta hydrolase/OsmC family protein [Sphingomonas sp. AR_OL41]